MTLMILPLCKIQWWWAHSSTSIMRGVCWGNVLHARQWAGVDGTCCTIHVTICSLSESLAPQACGLWNQAVGSVAGLILPAVLGATAQTCDLNQPALQPSLFFGFSYTTMWNTNSQTRAPVQLESAGMGRECEGANISSRPPPPQ